MVIEILGLKIMIHRGKKSQTGNSCSEKNVLGKSEFVIKLEQEGNSMARFRNDNDLRESVKLQNIWNETTRKLLRFRQVSQAQGQNPTWRHCQICRD